MEGSEGTGNGNGKDSIEEALAPSFFTEDFSVLCSLIVVVGDPRERTRRRLFYFILYVGNYIQAQLDVWISRPSYCAPSLVLLDDGRCHGLGHFFLFFFLKVKGR